jgi:predicted nucleotidyltransferase component of viral defense system
MQLQNEYYIRKLYPLQDKILRIVASTKNNFYLTGGTALSRFYLNHRFSDDLVFFVNGESDFLLQVDEVINKIKAEDDISKKFRIRHEQQLSYSIELQRTYELTKYEQRN